MATTSFARSCAAWRTVALIVGFFLTASGALGTQALGATSPTQPNVPQPVPAQLPLPTLQCAGYGFNQVFIMNRDQRPVPAATVVLWQLPKSSAKIGGTGVTFEAQSGYYKFQQPLEPGQGIGLNVPPPPAGGDYGPPPPPEVVALAIEFLRSCTISYATVAQMEAHAQHATVASIAPAAPTGLSVLRTDAANVTLSWTGGANAAQFAVYDVTGTSAPPDYRSWQNPLTVANNVSKVTLSIPRATTPQNNYFMVCAKNNASTMVSCSQAVAEKSTPVAAPPPALVHPPH